MAMDNPTRKESRIVKGLRSIKDYLLSKGSSWEYEVYFCDAHKR